MEVCFCAKQAEVSVILSYDFKSFGYHLKILSSLAYRDTVWRDSFDMLENPGYTITVRY